MALQRWQIGCLIIHNIIAVPVKLVPQASNAATAMAPQPAAIAQVETVDVSIARLR